MQEAVDGPRHSAEVRLQKLIAANHDIVSELSLAARLTRIVESAREIVEAEYAALGVIGPDGTLQDFILAGMDDATIARIGELPKGLGLLGALLETPEPIRLSAIADDPRSCGVPEGHPKISSFLGVPIRSATSVYGNLYLTNRRGRPEFSAEDQNLVTALAATAGVAIENARLHEQSQRRQEWLRAAAQVSHKILAGDDDGQPVLEAIASSVRRLTGADAICVVLPVADQPELMALEVVNGLGADQLRGLRFPMVGSTAHQAMVEQRVLTLPDFAERLQKVPQLQSLPPVRQVIALPLRGNSRARGAIFACRVADVPFSDTDVELAEGFVSQAGVALELADARTDRHQLSLLEDRARIARDLHDHVVQKLFAAGLTLQGTATMTRDVQLRRRLTGAIDNLDDTIRTIRTSIFELQEPNRPGSSVRTRVMAILGELTPVLGFAPHLAFEGPLDTMADALIINEVEAVLRESLTNVAKHASASAVTVHLATADRQLVMTVSDDGVGLRPSARRSGLANLRYRAEARGGRLELEPPPGGGLQVRWSIPLPH